MADKDLVSSNSYILRDCFSAELLRRIATPDTKKASKRQPGRYKKGISPTKSIDAAKLCDVTTSDHQQRQNDAEELAEFIDVCVHVHYCPLFQHDAMILTTAATVSIPGNIRFSTIGAAMPILQRYTNRSISS